MILRAPLIVGLCAGLLLASGCRLKGDDNADRPETSHEFPRAHRPVSSVGVENVGSEQTRDDLGEAQLVMQLANIKPGMSVADIGAGEGYYTVRLGQEVGRKGRVLAQDIDDATIKRLGIRVERERLDNVSIKLGAEDDPRLPENSFDRIFMVHVYHQVSEPYSFLWRLRPALRKGGQLIVVDMDRPADQHGIAPKLLFCEMDRVGFRLVEFVRKPELAGYYAQFEAVGDRPEPGEIEPCTQLASGNAKPVS